jgi:NAD(P)H dehydrogenase (quinone)
MAQSSVGMPPALAQRLADCNAGAVTGGLFDTDDQLGPLFGLPTTPLADSIKKDLPARELLT